MSLNASGSEVRLALVTARGPAASSKAKVDFAISKGAHKGIVYPENPLTKEQQKALSDEIKEVSGGGVDVIYDGVGGDYAEPSVRALNWEGRFLVIGFPAADIARVAVATSG